MTNAVHVINTEE